MRAAYSSSSVIFGLVGKEFADRAPDIFLRAEMAHADGGAARLELVEELGELCLPRTESGDAAGLHVAGVIDALRELREQRAGRLAVLRGIFAVRGVEEVGVVAAGVEALLHLVQREARDARGDRAAARGGLEELAFVEFPRLSGVREKQRFDLAVLPADALQREEEELLGQPPLRLVHAARDVEREDHRSVGRWRGALHQLTEAQVLVDDRHRILLDRTSFDRFLHRLAAIQAGARAALVPAFAYVVGLVHGPRALGLQLGKLELFPQPVDDLVDLELHHEADLAVAGAAAFARLAAFFLARLQHVARLAAALARALAGLRVEQPEARVLEKLDRHRHGAVRPRDQVRAGEEVGQALLDRRAHLLVVPQPIPCPPRKEFVPGGFGCDADGHSLDPLTRGS